MLGTLIAQDLGVVSGPNTTYYLTIIRAFGTWIARFLRRSFRDKIKK